MRPRGRHFIHIYNKEGKCITCGQKREELTLNETEAKAQLGILPVKAKA